MGAFSARFFTWFARPLKSTQSLIVVDHHVATSGESYLSPAQLVFPRNSRSSLMVARCLSTRRINGSGIPGSGPAPRTTQVNSCLHNTYQRRMMCDLSITRISS